MLDAITRTLAVIKAMKDELGVREKMLKGEYEKLADGAKHTATIDGKAVATISQTKATGDSYEIVDHEAFHDWCNANGVSLPHIKATTYAIVDIDLVREAFTRAGMDIEDAVFENTTHTYDVNSIDMSVLDCPDGVEVKKGRAGSVRVSMTPAQREALLETIPMAIPLLEAVTLEIEGK